MSFLLDTHYLLWSLFEPERIESAVQSVLEDPDSEKYVSGITFWEISLKYSIGKLELNDCDPEEVLLRAGEAGFLILPVNTNVLATYFKLPRVEDHRDPFDRMIIWHALQQNFTLVTRDKRIRGVYGVYGLRTLP